MRLNAPSVLSVRFKPGYTKMVTLVNVSGNRNVWCVNGLTDGRVGRGQLGEVVDRIEARGFRKDDDPPPSPLCSAQIPPPYPRGLPLWWTDRRTGILMDQLS